MNVLGEDMHTPHPNTCTKGNVLGFFSPSSYSPPFLAGIGYCCSNMKKASYVSSLYYIYSLTEGRNCLSLVSLLFAVWQLKSNLNVLAVVLDQTL